MLTIRSYCFDKLQYSAFIVKCSEWAKRIDQWNHHDLATQPVINYSLIHHNLDGSVTNSPLLHHFVTISLIHDPHTTQ